MTVLDAATAVATLAGFAGAIYLLRRFVDWVRTPVDAGAREWTQPALEELLMDPDPLTKPLDEVDLVAPSTYDQLRHELPTHVEWEPEGFTDAWGITPEVRERVLAERIAQAESTGRADADTTVDTTAIRAEVA